MSAAAANLVITLVATLTAEADAEGGYTGSSKAARILGSNNPSTFSRYCSRGVWTDDGRRVVLESIVIGGKRLTTRAAITRFLESQQPGQPDANPVPPLPRTPSARRRASEAASAKADELLA